MRKESRLFVFLSIILSICIYGVLMLLTPLKWMLMQYIIVLMISALIVLVIMLMVWMIKIILGVMF